MLPQSFSPPHILTNQDLQKTNIEGNKRNNIDDKNLNNSEKCSSDFRGAEKSLTFIKNDEVEGLLTIGLGQGKLKGSRTGFKPYKRCSMEAQENRVVGTASNQGEEEKGPKRIRLQGEEAST